MARPEQGLWNFLRERMPVGGHYSRIESHETAPGFPDVTYTLQSSTGGIELKCIPYMVKGPPFLGDRGLRGTQQRWIEAELAAGGRVLLCLQYLDTIYWLEGSLYKTVAKMVVPELVQYSELIWQRKGHCDTHALADLLRNP